MWDDLSTVAARFSDPHEFASSPLYRALAATVAEQPRLLRLAAQAQPGVQPTFLFFGAVHALLLAGIQHELLRYYPSLVGDAARPAEQAGPALINFCLLHEDQLSAIIRTRLVQSNVVRRALALRYGMAAIHRDMLERGLSSPIHLIEVGASAGLLLRYNRYGYTLGGQRFGDQQSPVQIVGEWRGDGPVPDLDTLPSLASVTGIDLNPLDSANPIDRRWLEALVWPENRYEADLLHQALVLTATDPPRILAGDAIEVLSEVAATLTDGRPRVVFHAITRLHVPPDRLAAFDGAISALGEDAPLYHLSLEGQGELDLRRPDGTLASLARVGGRVEWLSPVANS